MLNQAMITQNVQLKMRGQYSAKKWGLFGRNIHLSAGTDILTSRAIATMISI